MSRNVKGSAESATICVYSRAQDSLRSGIFDERTKDNEKMKVFLTETRRRPTS